MAHISGHHRSQALLFPESVDDYVGLDNPVRFIDAFVDGLDLAAAGFVGVAPKATGRPGYAPADLLKLYIYGYLNRVRSSRRLEAETYTHASTYTLISSPTFTVTPLCRPARQNKLARQINQEGTRVRTQYPERFGLFAVTPLPNIDLAIAEVAYAMDELGAEGVVVESNHHGLYHGDPKLEPFYAELNQRKAAMFVHPTSPSCPGCLTLALDYPRPMLEFMFETTRTVTRLILAGVTQRFPDIRVIVPHAGAALSILASRVDGFAPRLLPKTSGALPQLGTELPKLYFDLAGLPLPVQLEALRQIADPEHIFYGSDWPYTPDDHVEELAAELDASAEISDAQQKAYMFENALKLFPKFQKSFVEHA